jgi:P27 family predicted phage terminase small subunit
MNAPSHLDQIASDKWREILPTIEGRDQGTLDALTMYCSAWSQWLQAESKIRELGQVVKSSIGTAIPNPYISIAAASQRAARQWAGELGLTPAAKKKIARKAKAEEPKNDLSHILGIGRKAAARN